MQIYYFSRTGRSRAVAEKLALSYGTAARKIDDHRDWSGRINFLKAGAMSARGSRIPADYEKPDMNDDIMVVFPLWAGTLPPAVNTFADAVGKEHITAVVTSLGGRLKHREGFRKVVDMAGKDASVPEDIMKR